MQPISQLPMQYRASTSQPPQHPLDPLMRYYWGLESRYN
jgi:hypothetical protein